MLKRLKKAGKAKEGGFIPGPPVTLYPSTAPRFGGRSPDECRQSDVQQGETCCRLRCFSYGFDHGISACDTLSGSDVVRGQRKQSSRIFEGSFGLVSSYRRRLRYRGRGSYSQFSQVVTQSTSTDWDVELSRVAHKPSLHSLRLYFQDCVKGSGPSSRDHLTPRSPTSPRKVQRRRAFEKCLTDPLNRECTQSRVMSRQADCRAIGSLFCAFMSLENSHPHPTQSDSLFHAVVFSALHISPPP